MEFQARWSAPGPVPDHRARGIASAKPGRKFHATFSGSSPRAFAELAGRVGDRAISRRAPRGCAHAEPTLSRPGCTGQAPPEPRGPSAKLGQSFDGSYGLAGACDALGRDLERLDGHGHVVGVGMQKANRV